MRKVKPMLCRHSDEVFDDPSYIWETKYDGARIVAFAGMEGQDRLFGRSGSEKTRLFPEIKLDTKSPCVLDAEIISGTSFNDIQHRINRNQVALAAQKFPAILKVFDVLTVIMDGKEISVATSPLARRKEILAELVRENETVQLSEFTQEGVALYDRIEKAGGEGVVGKRLDGFYHENSREWLKVKTWMANYGPSSTGERFYAVGYTAGTGWRESTFGALVLARLDSTEMVHIGEVGTGFQANDLRFLLSMLIPSVCPWPREPERATWIKPFEVKVRYLEYTKDGKLRFPSFKGVV